MRSERGIGGRTERGRVGRRKGRGRGSEVAGTEKETEREGNNQIIVMQGDHNMGDSTGGWRST